MTIQEIYNDKETLESIKVYLINFLTQYGVNKMFDGKDTHGVGEAKTIIDEAFDNLDVQFGSKLDKSKKTQINSAR